MSTDRTGGGGKGKKPSQKSEEIIAERKKMLSRSAVRALWVQKVGGSPRCLHSSWESVLARLGLKTSDLPALKSLCSDLGLPAPAPPGKRSGS